MGSLCGLSKCRIIEIFVCLVLMAACIVLLVVLQVARPYAGIALGVVFIYMTRLWRFAPSERRRVKKASHRLADKMMQNGYVPSYHLAASTASRQLHPAQQGQSAAAQVLGASAGMPLSSSQASYYYALQQQQQLQHEQALNQQLVALVSQRQQQQQQPQQLSFKSGSPSPSASAPCVTFLVSPTASWARGEDRGTTVFSSQPMSGDAHCVGGIQLPSYATASPSAPASSQQETCMSQTGVYPQDQQQGPPSAFYEVGEPFADEVPESSPSVSREQRQFRFHSRSTSNWSLQGSREPFPAHSTDANRTSAASAEANYSDSDTAAKAFPAPYDRSHGHQHNRTGSSQRRSRQYERFAASAFATAADSDASQYDLAPSQSQRLHSSRQRRGWRRGSSCSNGAATPPYTLSGAGILPSPRPRYT